MRIANWAKIIYVSDRRKFTVGSYNFNMANQSSKKPPVQQGPGMQFIKKPSSRPLIKAVLILIALSGLLFTMLVAYAFIIAIKKFKIMCLTFQQTIL